MYEKAMTIPDNVLFEYFELTTDVDLEYAKQIIEKDVVNAHKEYAKEIIRMYHGEEYIKQAEERYSTVASGGVPENTPKFEFSSDKIKDGILLTELLVTSKMVSSKSEGKRMIEQNAISLNGQKENDVNKIVSIDDFKDDNLIIKKGKKQFALITIVY